MNNKILKQFKIDEKYVLSERKFLYTFGYLCLEGDLIGKGTLSKKQLYYFLEQRLSHASEEEVNLESVMTGRIILVGRGNNFRAYHRPQPLNLEKPIVDKNKNVSENKAIIERVNDKITYENKSNGLSELRLSELLEKYYENSEKDESIVYLEEIMVRADTTNCSVKAEPARCYKNKMKCYRKNVKPYI